jgi:folate-dependent phosphoribosylglycinamide formyltransferase PurN
VCAASRAAHTRPAPQLVPLEVVRCFKRRMLNIHPGLLPSFGGKGYYGARVHAAVLASGARFTGPTVHFVDEEYDTGPILAQRVVPVSPTDSPAQLAARVLEQVKAEGVPLRLAPAQGAAPRAAHIDPALPPSALTPRPRLLPACAHGVARTPHHATRRHRAQEHQVFPYALSALVDGRVTWRDDGIPVIWEAR